MFVFSLDGLKLRDIDKGVMGRRHAFALFHVSGKNVYRDMKQVGAERILSRLSLYDPRFPRRSTLLRKTKTTRTPGKRCS